MTDVKANSDPVHTNRLPTDEDEIDLVEVARVIWREKRLIIGVVVFFTLATAVLSLFMTNIYTAKAVLKPVSQKDGAGRLSSLASQFGGLANLAGIAMPGAASSTEIVNLLKSNILKKKIIEQYNLLPVLFPKKWDEEKKRWKRDQGGFSLNPLAFMAKLSPAGPSIPGKDPNIPDVWDGIRMLDKIVTINYNLKEDIVTITVNFRDPVMAAQIAHYYLTALNDHMSEEAKRISAVNKAYLEQQLQETQDSLVRQKIYNLIAEKIETMMMAEVKENFAYKILDPPMAPDKKSKPKRTLMVFVAFLVSAFLAVFVVLCRERFKNLKNRSIGGQNAV
jgi:uncharacterized protein involved in exopolysaccharide biosynthesis